MEKKNECKELHLRVEVPEKITQRMMEKMEEVFNSLPHEAYSQQRTANVTAGIQAGVAKVIVDDYEYPADSTVEDVLDMDPRAVIYVNTLLNQIYMEMMTVPKN